MILLLADAMERTDVVAEAVYEAGGRLLKVPDLHQRPGEIQIPDVGRLPLARLVGETIIDDHRRPARLVEHRIVHAETRRHYHAVIDQVFLLAACVRVVERNYQLAVPALDFFDARVDDGVLRLQLVGVENVVVDGPEVSDEVCLPRHVDRVRADEVDGCRCLDQILSRFKRRIALPDNQDFLVGELCRVD